MTTCPLCGYTFDKTAMMCHTACPLSRQCTIICCPNCGYQVPDEDRAQVVGALRRVWAALTARRGRDGNGHELDAPCPLTALHVGEKGEVTGFLTGERSRLAHLSALGVVPGREIMLCQRSLAYVVRVDETEVALDSQIAREIMVLVQ